MGGSKPMTSKHAIVAGETDDITEKERELKRSISTQQAISIVDQMLAGAVVSKDQLAVIKHQLSRAPKEWLSEVEDGDVKDSLMQLVMQRVQQPAPQIHSLPRGTTPAVCRPPRLRMAFVKAASWEMPVWEIDHLTKGQPLSAIVLWIFDEMELYDSLGLQPSSMRRFISRIEAGYRDNPYHNKYHAATVTLTMFQILSHSGIFEEHDGRASQLKLYILAAVLAAAVHDVNHPGVGNDFRVRAADEAALAYHDMYVNENVHLAQTFKLMRETGVLAGLEDDAYRIVRAVMIDMVLKTDMSVHFEVVAKFQASQTGSSSEHERRLAMLSMFLKCCDLAHTCFAWPEHVRWVKFLQEEFHRQGDLEKRLNYPNSPLTSREKSMAPTQAKLFEALIIPLYTELTKVFPACQPLLTQAIANWKEWTKCDGQMPKIGEGLPNGSPLKKSGLSSSLPPVQE